MKRLFVLFICCAVFARTGAQEPSDPGWKLARHADSLSPAEAIPLYLQAASMTQDSLFATGYYGSAGRKIIESAEKRKEKEAYRRALYLGKYDLGSGKLYWAFKLGKLYLGDGQYDSAYQVLVFARNIRSLRRTCFGDGRFFVDYNYEIMLALEGIGRIDDALAAFLPYAFDQQESPPDGHFSTCHFEEGDYHCLVADFVRILRKRYSASEIAQLFNQTQERSYLQTEKEQIGTVTYINSTYRVYFAGHYVTPFGTSVFRDGERAQYVTISNSERLRASMLFALVREAADY